MLDWNPDQKSSADAWTVANGIGANRGDMAGHSTNKSALPEAAATAEAEDIAREEQEGRQALMRLGIFLENNTVQEDTVDVLSSMGWL